MRLSICIEVLFAEGEPSFSDRIRQVAAAGVNSVEFWRWKNKNLDEVKSALDETGVQLVAFLSQPNNGIVKPAAQKEFVDGIHESCQIARYLGARGLIVVTGAELSDTSRREQSQAVLQALRSAAPIAEEAGITLLLEPLNTRVDHPGYFLNSTTEGLDLVEAVNSPSVKLLYDIYHSVMMGERTSQVLEGRVHLIGHVHVADVPGRHEPGTGDIDWKETLGWLRDQGYQGYIGLEYRPCKSSASTIQDVQILFNPYLSK